VLGIVLCFVALAVSLASLVLHLLDVPRWWGLCLIAAVILISVALLWGNVGVIFSHAGFTG